MKIFFIRHGQTTGDVEDRYGGDYDDHLTKLGEEQAQKLAENLQHVGIDKIFTSPLMRARETAELVNRKLNQGVEIVNELRERNHNGILSGMIRSEAREKYPQEVEKVKDYKTTAQGGEDYENFKGRVVKILGKLVDMPHQSIAIITHGGPIKAIFREILNKGEVDIQDCGYAVIDANNGQYTLLNTFGIATKQ